MRALPIIPTFALSGLLGGAFLLLSLSAAAATLPGPDTVETVSPVPVMTVRDEPADEGGQVRVSWTLAPGEKPAGTTAPRTFALYRRVDDLRGPSGRVMVLPDEPGWRWELVQELTATGADTFQVLAPTLVDSTADGPCWSVFVVRASTAQPGVFLTSAPDSACSVDNLAPPAPARLMVAGDNPPELNWSGSTRGDFNFFNIYRGHTPDFVPDFTHLVYTTTETSWVDFEGGPDSYYLVSAVDHAGNESECCRVGDEGGVASAGGRTEAVGDASSVALAVEF